MSSSVMPQSASHLEHRRQAHRPAPVVLCFWRGNSFSSCEEVCGSTLQIYDRYHLKIAPNGPVKRFSTTRCRDQVQAPPIQEACTSRERSSRCLDQIPRTACNESLTPCASGCLFSHNQSLFVGLADKMHIITGRGLTVRHH